jgi:2-oxoglutarate ferredoxin oxidoreductase subunit alpha
MNPAALKVNARVLKPLGVLIFDADSFDAKGLEKAGFLTDNPFAELKLSESIQLVPVPLSELTHASLKDSDMDNKSILRCKNMFALGLICRLCHVILFPYLCHQIVLRISSIPIVRCVVRRHSNQGLF